MFRCLNKMIKNNPLRKTLKSSTGQVAIILILVIASALIFYAVTLNFSRLGQVKAVVSVATDSSASLLGSDMSSYAQSLAMTSLKGRSKVCGWTGVFAAIITIIVIIIAIVASYLTGPQTGAAIMAAFGGLAGVGLALAVVALIIQIAIIQPGISDAWNARIQETLSMRNQFTEAAIQSALMKVATDPVKVPDMNDRNHNLRWETDVNNVPPVDTISRFAVYYDRRMEEIRIGDEVAFQDFFDALNDFVYITAVDDWGVFDPDFNCTRPECEPCCVPASRVVSPGFTEERPSECDPTEDWAGKCGGASPYGAVYPWVYRTASDNPNNTFFSFRELLGRDDEHQLFSKVALNPNGPQVSTLAPPLPLPPTNFLLEDTTRFYVPPAYDPRADNREGIFPFFYKMGDWGADLSILDFVLNPLERHWCDVRDPSGECIPILFPLEIPQLVLPLDPGNPASGLLYNMSYVVDGTGSNIFGNPPLAVDKVDLPPNIIADDTVCAQDALYPVDGGAGFWKRGGDRFCSDAYPYQFGCSKHNTGSCTDDDGEPGDCECGLGGTVAENFPDDPLDDLIYGLADFVEWAEFFLLNVSVDPAEFAKEFEDWYDDVAEWIEPPPPASQASDPPCFICDPDVAPGYLYVWLSEIETIRDRIRDWIVNHDDTDNSDKGYVGVGCTEVWCVPPGGLTVSSCSEVPPDEAATFNGNFNGVPGDAADIVGCLNYNVEGYDYAAGVALRTCLNSCSVANCAPGITLPEFQLDGVTPYEYPLAIINVVSDCGAWVATNLWFDAITRNVALAVNAAGTNRGNDTRFAACGNTCSLSACYSLPRSMVPPTIYDPSDYQPVDPIATASGNWVDMKAFENCRVQCNAENCRVGPRLPTIHTADATPYPAYPVAPLDCTPATWIAGNVWYDAIVANENSITLPDEADAAAFLNCFGSCSVANCNVMPDVHTSDATPYTWTASPATFAAGDCAAWAPGNQWYDEIVVNLIDAGGPSCDLDANEWLDQTRQSAIEAQNQIAKFKKRRDFLSERLAEAERMITILDDAANEFIAFLTGPAADLIRQRISYVADEGKKGLPYHAIYGWQSPLPPDADPLARGKWHIVKVEARVPGMCDTACGVSQERGSDPGWPRIRSYTKNWGTKRCYELTNTSGVVKFRTIRYDEERISGLLTFPNAVPIWNFRSAHPQRPQTINYDPSDLDAKCATSTIKKLPDGVTDTTIYDNAFIMSWYLDPLDPDANGEDNIDCWRQAHKLLTRGVVSETCAEYYWHGGTRPGMGFKFISCREF